MKLENHEERIKALEASVFLLANILATVPALKEAAAKMRKDLTPQLRGFRETQVCVLDLAEIFKQLCEMIESSPIIPDGQARMGFTRMINQLTSSIDQIRGQLDQSDRPPENPPDSTRPPPTAPGPASPRQI